MANRCMQQAQKFADAVNKLVGESVPGYDAAKVWDKAKCAELGYGNAEAGVVLEGTGLGAFDDVTIVWESGYGKAMPLKGMEKMKGVFAEPYASWLLLFYND